jgi:hypothetical protein
MTSESSSPAWRSAWRGWIAVIALSRGFGFVFVFEHPAFERLRRISTTFGRQPPGAALIAAALSARYVARASHCNGNPQRALPLDTLAGLIPFTIPPGPAETNPQRRRWRGRYDLLQHGETALQIIESIHRSRSGAVIPSARSTAARRCKIADPSPGSGFGASTGSDTFSAPSLSGAFFVSARCSPRQRHV